MRAACYAHDRDRDDCSEHVREMEGERADGEGAADGQEFEPSTLVYWASCLWTAAVAAHRARRIVSRAFGWCGCCPPPARAEGERHIRSSIRGALDPRRSARLHRRRHGSKFHGDIARHCDVILLELRTEVLQGYAGLAGLHERQH